jgi:hypothetical protein
MNWINTSDKPITKSGFYKVLSSSYNIHYARYIRPGSFMTGHGRDYRNGHNYPMSWPIKYIYLFGLNQKWEPDENVREEDWPDNI